MKIKDAKCFVYSISRIAVVAVVLLWVVFSASGCVALGFLLSAGSFEKGVPPAYDLQEQQDRKVLIWVECSRSASADFDVYEKLTKAIQLYMAERMEIEPENIILSSFDSNKMRMLDPMKIARSQGAGYVLLIQVDKYEADFLRIRDYYSGELVTRAVLYDVDLGAAVWPTYPEGKMVHLSVEMESEGRDALVSRLTYGAAHCTLRYLYPCDKLKFDCSDERVSMQEAYEIETY